MQKLSILLLAVLAACQPARLPQEGKISSQGTDIAYYDSGSGDTTLLFVHGWDINKEYWTQQVEHFKNHYRVVTVDLPGFGQSGKNRNHWGVASYGKDINALISQLQLKNVILIGHSMSGAIVLETALQQPAAVTAIVGVDNFKNIEPSNTQQQTQLDSFIQQARQHYTAAMQQFVPAMMFTASTDTAIKARVLYDVLHTDSTLAMNILQQGQDYPLADNLLKYKKRLYLINSDATPTDTAGFIRRNIPYALLPIHGSGHYPMLEQPDAFNGQLQQVINRIPLH